MPRLGIAGTAWRGEIVVVGGQLPHESTRVDAYSPKTRRWRRLPDLPRPVKDAIVTAGGGRLYVIGGWTSQMVGEGPSGFIYVLRERRWRYLAGVVGGRASGGAVVLGKHLYVVAGEGTSHTASPLVPYMYAVHVDTGKITELIGPRPRHHLAVTTSRGRIYAISGAFGYPPAPLQPAPLTDLVEVYDPGTAGPGYDRWRTLPPLPGGARWSPAATAVDGTIFVAGGGDQAGVPLASVYGFNVTTQRWRRWPDLRVPRHGLVLAAVDGRLYAVGGANRTTYPYVTGANEVLRVPSR